MASEWWICPDVWGWRIVMLKHEWMISVAKCFPQKQEGFLTMFWHNCPHAGFHREWSDCQHRGIHWHPTPLQKRFDFYWPCIDIRVYISPRLFSIPSPSRHNMQGWTLIHRRKVSRTRYQVLSNWELGYTIVVVGAGTRDYCLFLYSNTAVDCRTMELSPDSSFVNWMPKMCHKLLYDFGQWAKKDALYKPSEIALITVCGLLLTITTWQSLPSTSFSIPFPNPPYGRHRAIESIDNILGSLTS